MAKIHKKKLTYRISKGLRNYLTEYGREMPIPIRYDDLLRFQDAITHFDKIRGGHLVDLTHVPAK